MAWKKGETGNANGRPKKNRALTAILEKAGNAKRTGGTVAAKKVLADLLWEGATTGAVTFDDATKLLDAEDWLTLVKFLYTHIDGPPKSEIEVTGPNGGPLVIKGYATVTPDDWDANTDAQ